jgi:hypothetical protein
VKSLAFPYCLALKARLCRCDSPGVCQDGPPGSPGVTQGHPGSGKSVTNAQYPLLYSECLVQGKKQLTSTWGAWACSVACSPEEATGHFGEEPTLPILRSVAEQCDWEKWLPGSRPGLSFPPQDRWMLGGRQPPSLLFQEWFLLPVLTGATSGRRQSHMLDHVSAETQTPWLV